MTGSAEIPYLFSMLRRRFRVLVLGLLLGVLIALLLGSAVGRYEAQAQLLIGPPATGGVDATSLDRNLTSQLSVMRSREMARAVSESLGGEPSAEEVQTSTTVSQVAGADVVLIETVGSSPAQAEGVADAYVTVYLEMSAERAQARVAPELQRLDERLAQIDQEISAINQQLAAAVAPYLQRQTPGGVPDPRTLAPDAAAKQQLLLNEYDRLLAQRQTIEQEQQLRGRSSVLQEAVADEEPVGPDRRRQIAIVLVAGLVSVTVALALDAASGRPVSDQEVEQALGARIAARARPDRRLRGSVSVLEDPERVGTEDERLLRMRTERLLPAQGLGIVIATGSAAGAGASTVALSLAQDLVASGRETVLVDMAGGRGSITDQLGLTEHEGIAALLERPRGVLEALERSPRGVLMLGSGRAAGPVHRGDLEGLLHELPQHADVVVLDTEPGLGVAFGVAPKAHAIVLAIPGQRTNVQRLEELGLVLADFQDRLLPVLTSPGGRFLARGGRDSAGRGRGRSDSSDRTWTPDDLEVRR